MPSSTELLLPFSIIQLSAKPGIENMIADFLGYLVHEKGYSPNTLDAYSRDLKKFSRFCWLQQVTSINDLSYQFFTGFLKHLLDDLELADSSRHRTFEAVKTFFKFLRREGLSKSNPSFLGGPKVGLKLPNILSVDEVLKLLECPLLKHKKGKFKGFRNAALLELLYGSGLRLTEALSLKNQNIRSDRIIVVTGKGDKQRLVPITTHFLNALDLYKSKEKRLFSKSTDFVFPTSNGEMVDRFSFFRTFQILVEEVGIEKKVSPHTLRHSCATHMLDNGADIRIIQAILGHSDIGTTGKYLHLSIATVQKKFREHHPRFLDSSMLKMQKEFKQHHPLFG